MNMYVPIEGWKIKMRKSEMHKSLQKPLPITLMCISNGELLIDKQMTDYHLCNLCWAMQPAFL